MVVHISTFIRLFCGVTMAAIVFNGAAAGIPGAWYAIGMMGVIYAFSSRRLCTLQPLIPLLSVALCFYFGLRLWDYFVFDIGQMISFQPIGTMLWTGTAVPALAYGMYATAAMYGGLVLAIVRWRDPAPPPFEQYRPQVNADAFFFIMAAALAIQIALNGVFADMMVRAGLIAKLLSQATSHESLLPVAATIFARAMGWKPKAQLIVLFGGVVVSRMMGGTRSAPVDIAEIMLAWAIIPGNWNQTFRLSKLNILIGVLLVVASLGGFAAATAIRLVHYDMADTKVFSNTNSDDMWDIAQLAYAQIAYRVGTNFDALLYIFSNYYDGAYADSHVNLSTAWQTFLRRVFSVPMDPKLNFDEFEFAAMLGNRGNLVRGEWLPTSYTWGVFGYFHQLFKSWAVPVLFLLFFGIGRAFGGLQRLTPSIGRDFAMFWLAHAMELLVAIFGFSNLMNRARGAVISFVIIVVIMGLISGPGRRSAGYSLSRQEQ